ncbi:MAG: InlB B-repeat-containing protein [Lachnospiraceae bacterium]|nr:InlB B-repeat-containing protein [Lachnospiraceae bacterium]
MRIFLKTTTEVKRRQVRFLAFCLAFFLAFLPAANVFAGETINVTNHSICSELSINSKVYVGTTISYEVSGCGGIYISFYYPNNNLFATTDNTEDYVITSPTYSDSFQYWLVTDADYVEDEDRSSCYYTLEAIYNHTITFDENGHGTTPSSQTVITHGTVTQPDDLTAEHYTFGGWYTDSSCTNAYDFTSQVISDLTLYAKWTADTHTVTFDANGHGTAPSSQTIDYGDYVTEPDDPSATGYTFGGWYTDSDCTDAWDFTNDTVTSDTTLYAKWTANTYTVSFNANGHGSAPSSQTIDYGDYVTEPDDPSATGYTFGGWYTDSDCTDVWDFTSDTVTTDLTLYAKWTANTYTVSFNANGHGSAPSSQTISYGNKATKPSNPTASGYTFGGWYTSKSCSSSTAWDFASDTVTSNTTLYAKWTKNIVNISSAKVTLKTTSYTYSGSAKKPAVNSVKVNGKTLTKGTDYTVSYKNNKKAGTAYVVITGKGNYTGTVKKAFTIKKAYIKFSNTSKTYKYSKVKKAAQTFNGFTNSESGKISVTYKKNGKITKSVCKKYISVKKNGKITIKKKAPKGTYKFTVTVKSTTNYAKSSKTFTVKVK